MRQVSDSFTFRSPRSAKASQFLKALAWRLNLQVEVESTNRFFLAEDVFCRVRGSAEEIEDFKRKINAAFMAYNKSNKED